MDFSKFKMLFLALSASTLSACGGGGGGSGSGAPAVNNCGSGNASLSGTASFEQPAHDVQSNGLDYSNTAVKPMRGVELDLVCADGNATIGSTVSDAQGNYQFQGLAVGDSVKVRAKALYRPSQMQAGQSFSVRDNTDGEALYAIETAAIDLAEGANNLDFSATTGWNQVLERYSGSRAAAPFAILDQAYILVQRISAADPAARFSGLNFFWSPNNKATSGALNQGDIGSSFYFEQEIYILGDANSDTDEFDSHVVAHELAHYVEDQLARSNNIGGPHGSSDRLDMRVAFGEGLGNAWAAMMLDDAIYRDSLGTKQQFGFSLDVESNTAFVSGWYSEASVQSIIFDLFDAGEEPGDDLSLGFGPLYSSLVGGHKDSSAFTSIFSFIADIKQQNPSFNSQINALLSAQNISTNSDDYGNNESNNAGLAGLLPLYRDVQIDAPATQYCLQTNFADLESEGASNKLGMHRYLRFEVDSSGTHRIRVTPVSSNMDPDFVLFRNALELSTYQSATRGVTEQAQRSLSSGEYLLDVYHYQFAAQPLPNSYCFNVSVERL